MADFKSKLQVDLIAKTNQFNQAIGKAEGKIKSFSSNLTKTGKMMTTRLSLPLAALGTLAVKQAANFERLQTTLNTLTGSAEEGAAAFEKLVQFSAKTPFQLNELVKVNNTLMGFGLSTNQAFNSLSMLGDIAGIVGGDLQSIGVAFGQSAAEGRVMTRDLLQFINNGVPILDLLATSMGVAKGEIQKMASEGKISFDILNKAFKDATSEGGKFHNGMEVLSQTLNGLFSTLKDNVNIALAELGQEIADALNLKEGIPALSKGIGDLVTKFKSLDDKTKELIIIFGGAAGLFPLIAVFVGTTLPLFITGVTMLINPFTLAAAAVVGLTLALNDLLDYDVTKLQGIGASLNVGKFFADRKVRQMMSGGQGADVPSGFVGPLGPEQGTQPFSLVQDSGSFDLAEKAEATTESLRELATVVSTIVPRGVQLMEGAIIKAGDTIKTLPEKVKETGQVLVDSVAVMQPFLTGFANSLSGAFTNASGSFESFAMSMLGIIGDLLIQMGMAAMAASKLAKTFAIPGVGFAAGLAAFTLGTLIKAIASSVQEKGFKKMASGGIVSGPTTALIGEYPGARSNPEVVAPLSKLKSMIGGGAMQGEFVLRGQDLVVALQRAERNRNRFK